MRKIPWNQRGQRGGLYCSCRHATPLVTFSRNDHQKAGRNGRVLMKNKRPLGSQTCQIIKLEFEWEICPFGSKNMRRRVKLPSKSSHHSNYRFWLLWNFGRKFQNVDCACNAKIKAWTRLYELNCTHVLTFPLGYRSAPHCPLEALPSTIFFEDLNRNLFRFTLEFTLELNWTEQNWK